MNVYKLLEIGCQTASIYRSLIPQEDYYFNPVLLDMDASSEYAHALPTSPEYLYKLLKDLKIEFKIFEHPPLFTVNDAKKYRENMHGFHTKNLFLRDKKKKNYLVIAHEDSLIDLTLLTERIRSSRLSFGSKERLFEELGVFPGAVSPLSVVNNKKKDINIFLDAEMLGQDTIFCHPLVNDRTISLSYNSLLIYFDYLGLSFETVNLSF